MHDNHLHHSRWQKWTIYFLILCLSFRFTHCSLLNSEKYKEKSFNRAIYLSQSYNNLKYQRFDYNSSIIISFVSNSSFLIFLYGLSQFRCISKSKCHRLWGIITIRLIMRGNLLENYRSLVRGWKLGKNGSKRKWGRDARFYNNGRIVSKSGVTGGGCVLRVLERECTGVFPALESKLVFSSADAFLRLATVFAPGF